MCEEVLLDQRDRAEEGDQDRRDGSVHHLGIQSSLIFLRVFLQLFPELLLFAYKTLQKAKGRAQIKNMTFVFPRECPAVNFSSGLSRAGRVASWAGWGGQLFFCGVGAPRGVNAKLSP